MNICGRCRGPLPEQTESIRACPHCGAQLAIEQEVFDALNARLQEADAQPPEREKNLGAEPSGSSLALLAGFFDKLDRQLAAADSLEARRLLHRALDTLIALYLRDNPSAQLTRLGVLQLLEWYDRPPKGERKPS